MSGWRAVLADADTRLEPAGTQTLEAARAEALAYLADRLDRLAASDPATRRAGLRLALGRVERQREIS